ncbi:uncharacterized protein Z520_10868 [Fonsecaea multimorphosa CBS 102226]|uniref:Calcineurin-like phosphoesterase domain-containing protein n=1 Tax=Fonsecaea multimorphosa CBS 102226 TaxID=1442371 RepID=A0A0D2JSP0_9EURO|nr:uncharacterized protein Z520_10868 [Fonsecaea multimorphosa CBS 102226]KIX93449.1 hypothetical protein Z520_10868 [Fonsecaea multimorphosa CBS 102226]OAL18746.1 hypothetical protein AYO22_10439 [Fonsecaea multimorphosa]
MSSRLASGLPSSLFMVFSFFGALWGYWAILKHTSLVTAAFATSHVSAQAPLAGSPEALDPKLTNTIGKDVIKLYYNGTGPVPAYDKKTPLPEPITPFGESAVEQSILNELLAILDTPYYPDSCSKCIAAGQVLHVAAISQSVTVFTNVLTRACNAVPEFKSKLRAASCESHFSGGAGHGAYLAQLFSKMSLATGDMHYWCSINYEFCEVQPPVLIDEDFYFDPKPESANLAPEPSGHTFNVLHLSDWHLDPRYDIGSESNCSDYMCCRPYSVNRELLTDSHNASIPASRFGSFLCDSPADLALSALIEMPNFLDMDELAFSIFTGDIVSHDPEDMLSQAYVSYEEEVTFKVFKRFLGDKIPVYAALGNHDTLPVGFNTPRSMDPDPTNRSSNILQWNYDLLSSLWSGHSWLNDTDAEFARTHFGAYATTTAQGLRVISINSDFWYKENIFNYWNVTDPDPSGILKWMADELAACEKRGQRAWIIAHVLSGYDGSSGMPNPTALFYSIVRRFSPATIAAVFFGHTHQDQVQIFYDYLPSSLSTISDPKGGPKKTLRDTTQIDMTKPLQIGHIGPSITPLTGLNSGYRVYQIDAATFSVMGAQTYFANMSNSLSWTKPVWEFEYDTRQVYSVDREDESERDDDGDGDDDESITASSNGHGHGHGISWPATSPLNATFWHLVTEKMLNDSLPSHDDDDEKKSPLLQLYELHESKSSSHPDRRMSGGTDNPEQKVCFLRAGSGYLGHSCKEKFPGGGGRGDARSQRERDFNVR